MAQLRLVLDFDDVSGNKEDIEKLKNALRRMIEKQHLSFVGFDFDGCNTSSQTEDILELEELSNDFKHGDLLNSVYRFEIEED